jgi:hypothetical protein
MHLEIRITVSNSSSESLMENMCNPKSRHIIFLPLNYFTVYGTQCHLRFVSAIQTGAEKCSVNSSNLNPSFKSVIF